MREGQADSPSEPLVVVDDFDAGVLLTDLSAQLWLQPAHMYGAATEQPSQAECPLNPTPLRLRDHHPSSFQAEESPSEGRRPRSLPSPLPQSKLSACQASSWNTMKDPKVSWFQRYGDHTEPLGLGENTYLLWGNRAQHRGVANTRLGRRVLERFVKL